MVFSSMPGVLVIDDNNAKQFADDTPTIDGYKMCRGYIPRDYTRKPLGDGPFRTAFQGPYLSMEEVKNIAKRKQENKSRNVDLIDFYGSPCKNQAQTNYCWVNALVRSVEIVRHKQAHPHICLSPASAGAPLKNFQNIGGWGSEALERVAEHGVTPCSKWPANAIDSRYYTEDNKLLSLNYKVTEWWDLPAKSIQALLTCLCLYGPVPVGLLWWGHEVTALDAVLDDNDNLGVLIENSWGMDWPEPGKKGRAILSLSKANPDDAVCPRVAIAA